LITILIDEVLQGSLVKYIVTLLAGHGVLYIVSEDIIFEVEQTYDSLFLQ